MARTHLGWRSAAEAGQLDAQGSIPPNDVDGSMEQADVIVESDIAVTVGGRPARRLDFVVDPDSQLGSEVCPPDLQPCFWSDRLDRLVESITLD